MVRNISHVNQANFANFCIKTYMSNFDFFSAHMTMLMREIQLYTFYAMAAQETPTKWGNT